MYWYVLFVRTGREEKIEQLLKKQLNTDTCIPFIPLHEKLFRRSGTVKKEIKPLFPGYVFIESSLSSYEFIRNVSALIYTSQDILCVLRYSNEELSVRESEKQILLNLCNQDYCIEASSGIIEGDKIHIISGPLKGADSIVRKVNRHKRQAWIELEFLGEIRLISVAMEIVQKF